MTKPVYEIITNSMGVEVLQRTDPDGKIWSIPMDESNSDYQRYLNPEAEQSTPILPGGNE